MITVHPVKNMKSKNSTGAWGRAPPEHTEWGGHRAPPAQLSLCHHVWSRPIFCEVIPPGPAFGQSHQHFAKKPFVFGQEAAAVLHRRPGFSSAVLGTRRWNDSSDQTRGSVFSLTRVFPLPDLLLSGNKYTRTPGSEPRSGTAVRFLQTASLLDGQPGRPRGLCQPRPAPAAQPLRSS